MLYKAVRNVTLAVLAAAAAPSQVFDELSTNQDGSAVYFTASHRLKGSSAASQKRVYVVRNAATPAVIADIANPTYAGLTSASGEVLAYTEQRPPLPPPANSTTAVPVPPLTHLIVRGQDRLFDGEVVLSNDGRFAVLWGATNSTAAELLELGALTRTRIPYPVLRGRPVNSRGEVAGFEANRIVVQSPNGTTRFLTESIPDRIFLEDSGRQIFYLTAAPNRTLRAVDRTTLEDRPLQAWVRGDPAISVDGNIVVALGPSSDVNSPYQVIVFEGRTQPYAATEFPTGADAVTLSGNGRYIFATTSVGELVRVEIATFEKQTVITRTPALGVFAYGARVTPGSLTYLRGRGYSNEPEHGNSPLPGPLAGLELWFGSQRAALMTVQFDQLRFQTPFELPEGEYPVRLFGQDSPFESTGTVRIGPPAPLLLACDNNALSLTPSDSSIICALHEDRRTFVGPTSPARPNEIIRLLVLGLGQVDPALATGVISPATNPRLRTPVICRYSNSVPFLTPQGLPQMEMFNASVIPGDWGLYFFDVRVPSVEAEFLRIGCTATPGIETESRILPMPGFTIRPPRQ
ncbi:MAG: hypothetical protein JST93_07740 [Acidobacteria bacterium]|nr:hypothetical protein [Acidobacteriota bacterium]